MKLIAIAWAQGCNFIRACLQQSCWCYQYKIGEADIAVTTLGCRYWNIMIEYLFWSFMGKSWNIIGLLALCFTITTPKQRVTTRSMTYLFVYPTDKASSFWMKQKWQQILDDTTWSRNQTTTQITLLYAHSAYGHFHRILLCSTCTFPSKMHQEAWQCFPTTQIICHFTENYIIIL